MGPGGWGPKGGALKGGGELAKFRATFPSPAPNFVLYFSLSPGFFPVFYLPLGVVSCLFLSLWGSSRFRENLVVFFKAWTLKCARLGLGCRLKSPAA